MRALGCFLLVSCGSEPDRAPSSVEVTAMEAAPVHDQGQKAPRSRRTCPSGTRTPGASWPTTTGTGSRTGMA